MRCNLPVRSAAVGLLLLLVSCSGPETAEAVDPATTSTEMPTLPTSSDGGRETTPAGSAAASGITPPPNAAPGADDEFAAALITLRMLPVKGRAPSTGYSRAQFGQTWSDDVTVDGGHNGCDTRNDILRRDLINLQIKDGTAGCVVLSGTLLDQYTGSLIEFTRGANSDDVQIDHVVSLSDAWATGAQHLSAEQRQNLANDPVNLQAVAGPVNQAKGAGDAATWLPPNKSYRCAFVARQVEVKAKYQLWVKPAERDAIARVLGACTSADSNPTSPPTTVTDLPRSFPQSLAPDTSATGSESEMTAPFENCAAARAAGAAPLHVGDPGYSTDMDGDRDGVACE